MRIVLAPYPWPCIAWWRAAVATPQLCLTTEQRFEKRSYANRYHIGSANGLLILSIPLAGGRNQREPLNQIEISYAEDWQRNHWRSLQTAYSRAPFYEHYAPIIESLYSKEFKNLSDFSMQTIECLIMLLKMDLEIVQTTSTDSMNFNPKEPLAITAYPQPFDDRNDFLNDLSILDLLFCEGPNAMAMLKKY